MALKRKTRKSQASSATAGPKEDAEVSFGQASPEEGATSVRQVVEVVEAGEGGTSEALETIKKDAQEIEETVEKLEEEAGGTEGVGVKITESVKSRSPLEEDEDMIETQQEEEKREKERVEDLFREKPQVAPDISMHRSEKALPLWLWAIIVVGVALLVGSILVATFRGGMKVSLFATPTPEPTPTEAPTPTPPAPPVARGELTLEVLNGSGVAGVAARVKELLEGKGYTVGAIGNTDQYSYEKTEIHVKASKAGALSLLEEDLKESYTIGSSSADLPDDAAYDGRVIVGKE